MDILKSFPLFLVFQLYVLYSQQVLLAQVTQTDKNEKAFTGTAGIMFGSSGIHTEAFTRWMNENTYQGMSTTDFYHYGLEGFSVKNHVVYGLAWRHEGLFTSYSQVAPRRGSISFLIGACPTNVYSPHQLLLTIGAGYSQMTVKFHGSPPAVLNTYSVPYNQAILIQHAFWVNPKVNFFHLIKFRDSRQGKSRQVMVGLEAGVAFYYPGDFKYGYYYTYYSYGVNSKGQTVKQRHRKFIGYPVDQIPDWMTISYNISGYIGF